jgi:hypothetical protein
VSDVIFDLQTTAGHETHETLYGAIFKWSSLEVPCNHDGVMQNPPLMEGGFSPNTQTMISVRRDLFATTIPKKGDRCQLLVTADKSFNLQVQTVTTSPGNYFLNLLCADTYQGA